MKNKPASITVCAFSQSDKIELAPPEVVGRDLEWIFGAMMHCMTVGDGRKWVKRPEGLEENLCSFLPELKRDFNGANNDDRSSSLLSLSLLCVKWSSELGHKIPKVNLLLMFNELKLGKKVPFLQDNALFSSIKSKINVVWKKNRNHQSGSRVKK